MISFLSEGQLNLFLIFFFLNRFVKLQHPLHILCIALEVRTDFHIMMSILTLSKRLMNKTLKLLRIPNPFLISLMFHYTFNNKSSFFPLPFNPWSGHPIVNVSNAKNGGASQ